MSLIPTRILLIEDNAAEAELARECLEAGKLYLELEVVSNAVAASNRLFQRNEYKDAVRPDLIILDLNLPGRDGTYVLSEVKSDPELRRIPVVILTSSSAESDIARSYDLGANCYITKPLDLKAFQTIVSGIEEFWFTVAKLP